MQTIFIIAGIAFIGIEALFLNKINLILMTQEEEVVLIKALKDQNEKAKGEILAKFAVLEGQIAAGGSTSPEVDAALADLKASIQGTDDIVPDAPPADGGNTTPPPTEEPAA